MNRLPFSRLPNNLFLYCIYLFSRVPLPSTPLHTFLRAETRNRLLTMYQSMRPTCGTCHVLVGPSLQSEFQLFPLSSTKSHTHFDDCFRFKFSKMKYIQDNRAQTSASLVVLLPLGSTAIILGFDYRANFFCESC